MTSVTARCHCSAGSPTELPARSERDETITRQNRVPCAPRGARPVIAPFAGRKLVSREAAMACVSRKPMHLAAVIAAAVIAALMLASPAGARVYPDGTYIYISKQVPERLYLIEDGRIVFVSPANTGSALRRPQMANSMFSPAIRVVP